MARLQITIVFVVVALTAVGSVVLPNASFSRTIAQNTDRKGGTIAGRVIDVEGSLVPNVLVSAERSDMIRPISTGFTNEHGEFVINDCRKGYTLFILGKNKMVTHAPTLTSIAFPLVIHRLLCTSIKLVII